jgi:hypothetical protein
LGLGVCLAVPGRPQHCVNPLCSYNAHTKTPFCHIVSVISAKQGSIK